MRGKARLAVVAVLALSATGCDFWYSRVPSIDYLWHEVPWFDHMVRQRSIHPYEMAGVPRHTVAGTVPITGGEADWAAEWATGKTGTADALVNPAKGPSAHRAAIGGEIPVVPADMAARGDSLYQTYCSMCHGPVGAGGGLVGQKMGAPALTTDRARAFSDGYLYSIVRYGRGVMPRYGDKIYDPADRWAVVNHVRKLQGAAPAGAAPAPASGGQN